MSEQIGQVVLRELPGGAWEAALGDVLARAESRAAAIEVMRRRLADLERSLPHGDWRANAAELERRYPHQGRSP